MGTLKVIWVVRKEENEGKSFFQANIREEFGYSRVCKLESSENSHSTFHRMGRICSRKTDIFLFNVARGVNLDQDQYKILESIKDGKAVDGKYMGRQLNFKKPYVLIVFSNNETTKNTLSKVQWTILKITNYLTELTDIGGESGNTPAQSSRLLRCFVFYVQKIDSIMASGSHLNQSKIKP